MESIESARFRLASCGTPRGASTCDLAIGDWTLRFEGIDEPLAATLGERWGGFVQAAAKRPPRLTVRVVRGEGAAWIPPGPPGEAYRLEAGTIGEGVLVRSYHFALAPDGARAWRLAIEPTEREPLGRVLDNAARYLVARLAVEAGGAAFHGAGVLRDERVWIFAGPSRSGKSTAVSHSAPGVSLGDDFAVVLPTRAGWGVPAVPFDNAERAPDRPARTLMPLARVLRLHHAARPRLEVPQGPAAHASLMACLAFPWALPDLAEPLQDAVASLIASGRFAHLWFAPEPSFWSILQGAD